MHPSIIFSTQEHLETIKMLQLQLKGLEQMAEEIQTQIKSSEVDPVDKINMQLSLFHYNKAKEKVEQRVKEFIIRRKEALN